ncbi:MAG: phosphate ABC transporter permease PstA [Lentisphaeraceae bacterium]|nr:phosphate ABC transporter permease PstA [Lentisphaeraceae bacterium]
MKKNNTNKPKGDSWVWFTSLGLSTGLLMVTGILIYILCQGLSAFWPKDVAQVKVNPDSSVNINGSKTIAGVVVKDQIKRKEINGEFKDVQELQLFVANRDLYNLSFIYIDKKDIEQKKYPENLMMVERLNDSKAIIIPTKLIKEDKTEIPFEDASFEAEFSKLVQEAENIRDKAYDIQVGPISDIVKKNKNLVVDQYPYYEKLKFNNETIQYLEQYRNAVESLDKISIGFLGLPSDEQAKYPESKEYLKLFSEAQLKLSEIGGSDFKNYQEIQEKISKGKVEESELVKQVTSLQKDLNKHTLEFTTASGYNSKVTIGNVIHYFYPNRLSTGNKIGMFFSNAWNFLTEDPRHANTEGGVFPAIVGTLMMTILMCIFVTPFGVIAAIFLHEYAKQGTIVRMVRIAINNLAGVPSIVYGAFGLAFFVYYVGGSIDELFYGDWVKSGNGAMFGTGGMLWASLTLALLTVPVVIVATEEALAAVPRGIREGALGCGASKWQMIKTVVLPACAPGIITGMILAMARGAGEVAPLMLVGVADIASELPIDSAFPFGLERKFLHLGYNVYHVGFKTVDSEASQPLVFATTLLLISIVALLNLAGIIIRQRLKKRYATSAF